ncbi:hypothetical protein C8F04DRAFT_1129411 [Mycena alexandri]|uniref:F-box domain-containing protein n=1 Tax=Mycena alexandri TaxID=1745969 RepID=A0AAD6SC56_9AGAR|nr:hypothetical protein C8F04DRAFT_1129411 [Mycena alexandri]
MAENPNELTQSRLDSLPQRTRIEEMSAIDHEIAWHYAQISLLKAKRNAMAPICALPNELMTRILTMYAIDNNIFELKWAKIMYVCRHWYELALAAQPLWGFIDLEWRGSYDRLFGQLKRSGVAPLTIKFKLFDSAQYTDIILDQSERIYHLEVGGEAQYVYELIGKLPQCNLPILSSLSLDPTFRRDELPEGFVEVIPEAIFDGNLPNLCELELSSVGFPWGSLSGLTSLSLTTCHDSSAALPSSFHSLLEMLGSCPQLRTVKLEMNIPLPAPEHNYPTVALSALTWLRLRDHVTQCTALLNHLQFPPAASVHILPSGVYTGVNVREILVPMRKHTRGPGAQTLSLLQIDCHATSLTSRDISYCTMAMFTDTEPHEFLERIEAHCAFSLNFHPNSELALRQIVTKVLNAVPAHLITHLDARNMSYPGEVSWRAFVQLLPALDTVYLRVNASAVHCIHALTQIETLDSQQQKFPRIRRLHVLIIRPEPGDDMIVGLMTSLEAYFAVCAANQNPFETLEMDDRHHVLSQAARQEQLERLFPLMENRILWNGEIYDPVKRREELAKLKEHWKALAVEYGLETE